MSGRRRFRLLRTATARASAGGAGDRRRSRLRKLALCGAVLLGAMVASVVTLAAISYRDHLRESAEAPVEILEEDPVTWSTRLGAAESGYSVTIRYVVDGENYQYRLDKLSEYDPNGSYKVCYDPNHPAVPGFSLREADYECGGLLA